MKKITKEFKTIDEQLEILLSRNLKFRDIDQAYEILAKYNYFDVINGFESILLKQNTENKVYENVYFEDFKDLFFFDFKLKKLMLNKILDFEAKLRTSIAYNFASTYCKNVDETLNYLDKRYYKAPPENDTDLTNKFNKLILFKKKECWPNGNVRSKSFLEDLKRKKNYVSQYENPPFWVTIKTLSFGSLCYIFVFLKDDVKEKVLSDFGLKLKDAKKFEESIYVLKEMRNQCAHLELITRFRLNHNRVSSRLNHFHDIRKWANLSNGKITFLDGLKIIHKFSSVDDIKICIFFFYISMCFKGRKAIADKALSKMGRKKLSVWMKI